MESQAGPSNSGVTRFLVQSSDVIQDMRINVSKEGSDKVLWYKERYLADMEIIENVVHNPSNTVCWTIHRPTRGWYIRIRSPLFPPNVFIPLTPVPSSSPYHTDAALTFHSRTNKTITLLDNSSNFTLQDDDAASSTASIHSYPPTPPAVIVRPPSPEQEDTTIDQNKKVLGQKSKPSHQLTQFVISPTSSQPAQTPTNASFFSRAFSVLKSHRPSNSNSFTLSRVPSSTPPSPPPPYVLNLPLTAISAQSSTSLAPSPPELHTPLLTYHDQTPVLTVRSLTGTLEIDRGEEELLGVDTSFWIAVALTYLEFLEERESYLAALSD